MSHTRAPSAPAAHKVLRRRVLFPLERTVPGFSRFYFKRQSTFTRLQREIRRRGASWDSVTDIYVHIPKTGGTSMKRVLVNCDFEYFFSLWAILKRVTRGGDTPTRLSLDHMHTDLLVELGLVSEQRMNDIFSFATIRNPVDRYRSAYFHHLRLGRIPQRMTFSRYLDTVKDTTWPTTRLNEYGLSHANSSHYWLRPHLWRGPRHLLPIENNSAIEALLLEKYGQSVSIPSLNPSRPPNPDGAHILGQEFDETEWVRREAGELGYSPR